MRLHQTAALAATAALCAFATGCGGSYRAETTLHADGSLDRAIYQPADGTPEAARQAKLWKEITFAPHPDVLDRTGWPDALTLLPAHPQDKDHPYFAAWNHFASVEDVPDHVLFKSPEGAGMPDGKLERQLTRIDLGFVEELNRRETLTDVTTLTDMRKARDELADGAIRFGQDVFAEAAGKEYDSGDLVRWLNTEGKDWFREATDAVFLNSAAYKGPDRSKAIQDALAACCEEHGLKLRKDGRWLKDEEATKVAQDFVVNLVAEKVKKDGKPVGRDTARGWLDELNLKDGGRFKVAAEKVVAQKYGGEKTFGDRVTVLIDRTFGLYHLAAAPSFHTFQYTMTFPGPVIETNGELLAAGDKVRWRFAASDAYPLGFPMEARCLLPSPDVGRLPGGEKLLSGRDALTTYADLVRGDASLEGVMRRCRTAGTLDPLDDFLAEQKKKGNAGPTRRAEKVIKLLKAS